MSLDSDNEDVRAGKGRQEGGGSIIQAHDPIFRNVMRWSWGVFGTVFMGMQVWLVSNVADIKTAMQVNAEKSQQVNAHLEFTDKRVSKLEDRADYMSGKIYEIEGRQLRSIAKGDQK